MPALKVFVDGSPVATVATDGYSVVTTSVAGARIDEPFAHLTVSAGHYPDEGPSTYLLWVSDLPLMRGQHVAVQLLESAPTSHRGKTIDELFPDEAQQEQPAALNDVIETLRLKPRLHDHYRFLFETSNGTSCSGEAPTAAHGFGFSVLWNWLRPERVSASLHTYTLDDLKNGNALNDLAREYVAVGGTVRLVLVA